MGQNFVLRLDNKSISSNLCVDTFTIHRVVSRFNKCGIVTNKLKIVSEDCRETKLTKSAELTILNMVLQKPGIYLREIQEEMTRVFGVDVHEQIGDNKI